AGSPPFPSDELKKAGLLEMLRVVREQEPPRPSTRLSTANAVASLSANRGTEPKKLAGMLRNEIDWIVMRSLEKDRARRYDSPAGRGVPPAEIRPAAPGRAGNGLCVYRAHDCRCVNEYLVGR